MPSTNAETTTVHLFILKSFITVPEIAPAKSERQRFTSADTMENRPGHEPANSGNGGETRRRAAWRQEEINAPRNASAGRRQTAKQEENTRKENRAKVRKLHLALGKQTHRAEIRARGALVME